VRDINIFEYYKIMRRLARRIPVMGGFCRERGIFGQKKSPETKGLKGLNLYCCVLT